MASASARHPGTSAPMAAPAAAESAGATASASEQSGPRYEPNVLSFLHFRGARAVCGKRVILRHEGPQLTAATARDRRDSSPAGSVPRRGKDVIPTQEESRQLSQTFLEN